MTKQTFEELLRGATQEFKGKKKQPTTPAKQFEKGAMWLWDLPNIFQRTKCVYLYLLLCPLKCNYASTAILPLPVANLISRRK